MTLNSVHSLPPRIRIPDIHISWHPRNSKALFSNGPFPLRSIKLTYSKVMCSSRIFMAVSLTRHPHRLLQHSTPGRKRSSQSSDRSDPSFTRIVHSTVCCSAGQLSAAGPTGNHYRSEKARRKKKIVTNLWRERWRMYSAEEIIRAMNPWLSAGAKVCRMAWTSAMGCGGIIHYKNH